MPPQLPLQSLANLTFANVNLQRTAAVNTARSVARSGWKIQLREVTEHEVQAKTNQTKIRTKQCKALNVYFYFSILVSVTHCTHAIY